MEDQEGLVYEIPVQTGWHEGMLRTNKPYLNLSIQVPAIVRALDQQAPIPPEFSDDTDAQAWLDRYPVQT